MALSCIDFDFNSIIGVFGCCSSSDQSRAPSVTVTNKNRKTMQVINNDFSNILFYSLKELWTRLKEIKGMRYFNFNQKESPDLNL